MTRAKFKVHSITRVQASAPVTGADGKTVWVPAEMQTIKMGPVTGNGDPNHENTKFWNATPQGSVEFGCVSAEAVREFDLGTEFYVDFTPVPVEG